MDDALYYSAAGAGTRLDVALKAIGLLLQRIEDIELTVGGLPAAAQAEYHELMATAPGADTSKVKALGRQALEIGLGRSFDIPPELASERWDNSPAGEAAMLLALRITAQRAGCR